eukprot:TRINITY_DN5164_c0_g1_i3.p1 TRINITY_DN5164_c0_g1~~TRINITY_DN5164_c0_g1_i3.p1  ORF type:complete len:466 (+),score=196.50 TRINITY_DN5164_c0_g1_i3:351-1748(+)
MDATAIMQMQMQHMRNMAQQQQQQQQQQQLALQQYMAQQQQLAIQQQLAQQQLQQQQQQQQQMMMSALQTQPMVQQTLCHTASPPVSPPHCLRGPDGDDVIVPAIITVKDPAVRGNIQYKTPSSKIRPTFGMWEYLAAQKKGKAAQCHRATICKLYLDDRCGHGMKCKSFHIQREFVEAMRRENKVEFDQSFLTEVAVECGDGTVCAIRYNSIGRTKGLDNYKSMLSGLSVVPPAQLCQSFATGETCSMDRACTRLHVKPADLKECIRRTPCCYRHGDKSAMSIITPDVITITGDAGATYTLQSTHLSLTAGCSKRLTNRNLTITDVCVAHVKTRCKYGRGCDRLHVCRAWSSEVGLMLALNHRGAMGRVGQHQHHQQQPQRAVVSPTLQMAPLTAQLSGLSLGLSVEKAQKPPGGAKVQVDPVCASKQEGERSITPDLRSIVMPRGTVLRAILRMDASSHQSLG